MRRVAKMIKWYRKSINPPYTTKDLLTILATLFILVAIPLTVISIVTVRNFQPRAAPAGPTRGVAGDLWADVIIGQSGFGEIMPYPVDATRLFRGGGCAIDRTNNRMYLFDANNRILGLDLTQTALTAPDPAKWSDGLGAVAQIVIGQPDMVTSAANGDSGFQNYPSVASATRKSIAAHHEEVGSVGEAYYSSSMVFKDGALYVADLANNRVLKFANPWQNYPDADDVWGQDDFVSRLPNKTGTTTPSASSLSLAPGGSEAFMSGVDVDSSGALWVTDTQNSRVLRFPAGSKTANLVFGQSTFTSSQRFWVDLNGNGVMDDADAYSADLNKNGVFSDLEKSQHTDQFNRVMAVRVSPWTDYVYVADNDNNRVLRFLPDLTGNFKNGMSGELFGSGIDSPTGIDFDPNDPGNVWIMNRAHGLVQKFRESDGALLESLQLTVSPFGNVCFAPNGDIYATGMNEGGPTRVKAGVPTAGYTGRAVFGTTGTVFGQTLHSPAKLEGSGGVVAQDNQLIAVDWGRILAWDKPDSLTNGQAANYFAGADGAISDYNHPHYGAQLAMRGDEAHHIWVTAGVTPHVAVYQTPLHGGDQPVATLSPPFNALGGGSVSFPSGSHFDGVAPSPDGKFVWLASPDTNRVIRIRDPLTNPLVDVVLGQRNLSGTDPNQSTNPNAPMTMSTLKYPGSVALDRFGNVWVSDHANEGRGNQRLLMYPAADFTGNSSVVFAPQATKAITHVATYEVAFDSQNRMVVTYSIYGENGPNNGRFVAVYTDPLALPNGSSTTSPDFFLSDYGTFTSAWFDVADNLYVGDSMRSRVLIYKTPLGTPVCTRAIPAVSVSPTSRSGAAGASVDYNVSVTNNDTSVCGSSIFSLSFRPNATWTGSYNPAALTLAPGATGQSNFRLASPATASPGKYTFIIVAMNEEDTNYYNILETVDYQVVTPAKPGDLDGDGDVDITDLSILLSNWGQSGGVADINKDGKVDVFDLSILLSNWGS